MNPQKYLNFAKFKRRKQVLILKINKKKENEVLMLKLNICSDVNKYLYLYKVLTKVFTIFAGNLQIKWLKRQKTKISY